MEPTQQTQDQIRQAFPHCEIVERPHLFSHVAEEDMSLYCDGIQQGRKPDGTLAKGEKVATHHKSQDPDRPWIITASGVVAQVQGRLRSIPL